MEMKQNQEIPCVKANDGGGTRPAVSLLDLVFLRKLDKSLWRQKTSQPDLDPCRANQEFWE